MSGKWDGYHDEVYLRQQEAEIERLRANLTSLHEEYDRIRTFHANKAWDACAEKNAEIDRLRAALDVNNIENAALAAARSMRERLKVVLRERMILPREVEDAIDALPLIEEIKP